MGNSFMPPEVQAVGNTVREGVGLLGTISQGLGAAWDLLWMGAFIVLGGGLLFNTEIGKSITSFFTDFLKGSEWGKAILAFLDQYLTPILTKMGSDSPFAGFAASYVDKMTPEQFAEKMKKDFNLDADVSSKLFESRNKLFAANLDKNAIATPEGLKKLLSIIPDDAALKLMNQSKNAAATATSADAEFNKKLKDAIQALTKDVDYAKSLSSSHPKLMEAIIKDHLSLATPVPAPQPPAPAPAPAVTTNNTVLDQLIGVKKNQEALIALNAAIASAPEPQKQAVMATIASVVSGKFDLANKDELVKFFADEKQRKAVTDFIINLDVSTITDDRTKKLLAAVQKAAPALGTVLADQKSVDYLIANKDKPENVMIGYIRKLPETAVAVALKTAGAPAPIADNFSALDALTTALKEYEKAAPASTIATETPAPAPAPQAPQKQSAISPVDAGLAAAVQQAALSGDTSKNITVLDVTTVDPKTARMIAAAQTQASNNQAIG